MPSEIIFTTRMSGFLVFRFSFWGVRVTTPHSVRRPRNQIRRFLWNWILLPKLWCLWSNFCNMYLSLLEIWKSFEKIFKSSVYCSTSIIKLLHHSAQSIWGRNQSSLYVYGGDGLKKRGKIDDVVCCLTYIIDKITWHTNIVTQQVQRNYRNHVTRREEWTRTKRFDIKHYKEMWCYFSGAIISNSFGCFASFPAPLIIF